MLDVNKKTFGGLFKRTDKEEKKKKKKRMAIATFFVLHTNAKCPKRVFKKFPKISMTWF